MGSNMLRAGAEWLAGQLADHASDLVTYRLAEGSEIANLPATRGRSITRTEDRGAVRLEYSARDYLIQASLLVFEGNPVEPLRGHQILDGEEIWEAHPGDGEKCYRLEPQGVMLRIHAKRVG